MGTAGRRNAGKANAAGDGYRPRMKIRTRAAVVAVAAAAPAVLAAAPAQAAGYSFYQGCGGAGQAAVVYLASGWSGRLPCGQGLSGNVIQVSGGPFYAERVNTGGGTVCVLPGQRVTLRGTGSSGTAQYRC